MNSLRGGLVTALTASALVILPMSNTRVTRIVTRAGAGQSQSSDPKTIYVPQQKEYWLSADEFGYIRPGLHITVNSITIGDDRKAVVDLSYTDDLNQPLDRKGQITAGPISTSFILSWWDPSSRNYTAYTTRKRRARSRASRLPRPVRIPAEPSRTSIWVMPPTSSARLYPPASTPPPRRRSASTPPGT